MALDERELLFRFCGNASCFNLQNNLQKNLQNNLQNNHPKNNHPKTIIPSAGRTFTAHEHVYPDDLHIAEM